MTPITSTLSSNYQTSSTNLDGSRRGSGDVQGTGESFDVNLASGVETAEDQVLAESASPNQAPSAVVELVSEVSETESTLNRVGTLVDTVA